MLTCKYSRDKLCNSGSRSPPWPQGYDWGSKHPLSTAAPDPNLEDPVKNQSLLGPSGSRRCSFQGEQLEAPGCAGPLSSFPPLAG